MALHVRNLDASIAFYEKYCALQKVHDRSTGSARVAWLATPGEEQTFVFVLIDGGQPVPRRESDFSHLGFAVDSKARVDALARAAEADGILIWKPSENPFPVGYYCGIQDPDGHAVEISYGQPLGPGAEPLPRYR